MISWNPFWTRGSYRRTMDQLEKNQVELIKDTNVIKGNMDHMLKFFLARSKNHFQHAAVENVSPSSGFTVVTNPMYSLPLGYIPPQVRIHTQPHPVHILVSNKVPIM